MPRVWSRGSKTLELKFRVVLFRVLATEAYQRRFSITGELTLRVLHAPHIKLNSLALAEVGLFSFSEKGDHKTVGVPSAEVSWLGQRLVRQGPQKSRTSDLGSRIGIADWDRGSLQLVEKGTIKSQVSTWATLFVQISRYVADPPVACSTVLHI